jgi:hypothetical protein
MLTADLDGVRLHAAQTITVGDSEPVLVWPAPIRKHGKDWVLLTHPSMWIQLATRNFRMPKQHHPAHILKECIREARVRYSHPGAIEGGLEEEEVPPAKVRRTKATAGGGWRGVRAHDHPVLTVAVPASPGSSEMVSLEVLNSCVSVHIEFNISTVAWAIQYAAAAASRPCMESPIARAPWKPQSRLKGVHFDTTRRRWVVKAVEPGERALRFAVQRWATAEDGTKVPLSDAQYKLAVESVQRTAEEAMRKRCAGQCSSVEKAQGDGGSGAHGADVGARDGVRCQDVTVSRQDATDDEELTDDWRD